MTSQCETTKRQFLIALTAAIGAGAAASVAGPARAQSSAEAAKTYVDKVAGGLLRLIRSGQTLAQKKATFKRMIVTEGAVKDIARAAIGAPWRQMNASQRTAYTNAFLNYLAKVYAERFDDYSGETFKVISARRGPRRTIYVASQVARPNGGQKLNVEWRVRQTPSGFKVLDIIVEGVSLVVQQRSELTALLDQSGGDIDAFIRALTAYAA